MRKGHCRPHRPPRYRLGCIRPVSGLTSDNADESPSHVAVCFGSRMIQTTQWRMIRRYSFTVAGAAPALRIRKDGRTGFPFHSRG